MLASASHLKPTGGEAHENNKITTDCTDTEILSDAEEAVGVSLTSTELQEDPDDWLNIDDEEAGLQETTGNMQSPEPVQRNSDREKDFFNILNGVEPESGRKASQARATKKASEGSSAPNVSSPIVSSPVTRSLSRKPTPATQNKTRNSGSDGSAHPPCSPSSPMTRAQARKSMRGKHNTKDLVADHSERVDLSKLTSKDLKKLLFDEAYSTIALAVLGCKTKSQISSKIGKYMSDMSHPSGRKAFVNHSTKPLDEKVRLVVEDAMRRNVICLEGKAAKKEGLLMLERLHIKIN
ncbi:hypothetical protein R1sor_010783 [Riccia sorocarpa]|uniref:Uncharacterized protein n=1 Tax=Riccia sorocarpa TaxID=122646 RepID=A0ABD3HZ18_9MARC